MLEPQRQTEKEKKLLQAIEREMKNADPDVKELAKLLASLRDYQVSFNRRRIEWVESFQPAERDRRRGGQMDRDPTLVALIEEQRRAELERGIDALLPEGIEIRLAINKVIESVSAHILAQDQAAQESHRKLFEVSTLPMLAVPKAEHDELMKAARRSIPSWVYASTLVLMLLVVATNTVSPTPVVAVLALIIASVSAAATIFNTIRTARRDSRKDRAEQAGRTEWL